MDRFSNYIAGYQLDAYCNDHPASRPHAELLAEFKGDFPLDWEMKILINEAVILQSISEDLLDLGDDVTEIYGLSDSSTREEWNNVCREIRDDRYTFYYFDGVKFWVENN